MQDTFLLGAYRKVATGRGTVMSPMTSHDYDVTVVTSQPLQQFLVELDHLLT